MLDIEPESVNQVSADGYSFYDVSSERAMGLNIHRRDGRGEESGVTWAVALGTTVKVAEDI